MERKTRVLTIYYCTVFSVMSPVQRPWKLQIKYSRGLCSCWSWGPWLLSPESLVTWLDMLATKCSLMWCSCVVLRGDLCCVSHVMYHVSWLPLTVFEIRFEASQTFELTGFEVSPTEPQVGRQKTYFSTIWRILLAKLNPWQNSVSDNLSSERSNFRESLSDGLGIISNTVIATIILL